MDVSNAKQAHYSIEKTPFGGNHSSKGRSAETPFEDDINKCKVKPPWSFWILH